MRRSVSLSLLILAASTATGHANRLFEGYFSKAADGKPCYARQYTAKHLAEHPRQQVTAIEIDYRPANPDGVLNTAKAFELGFGVKRRGSDEWFTNSAFCTTQKDRFECGLEGDGGKFRLRPSAHNRLRLELVRDTIAIEGADSVFEFGGSKSDDNVFLIPRADRKVCDAATADVSP